MACWHIWVLLLAMRILCLQAFAALNCDFGVNSGLAELPFCNRSLARQDRVRDLVERLTLDEKVGLLVSTASGVERLGIPSYEWWQEALHGVAESPGVVFGGEVPGATSFPQVILTAASFNTTLWNAIGEIVSTEARVMYNARRAGLTYWAPNLNIFRDPRWGRGQETPGEDPLVASKYGAYFVQGLQGYAYMDEDDVDPQTGWSDDVHPIWQSSTDHGNETSTGVLKVSACCKHFTAYDLDYWNGTDRYHFDAQVTLQDMEESYEPPFKHCIEKGLASCLMCSYNRVNGVPTCADRSLLTGVARNSWGFDGYIVTDCGAIDLLFDATGYAPTPEDAVANVLQAGVDLDCGTYLKRYALSALNEGKVNESMIDTALTNTFTVQMRLGMFDSDPRAQPYASLGLESICSQENQNLALEAAKQGIVLMKNDNDRLPLSRDDVPLLAVIGPHADASRAMLGDYCGFPCRIVSPLTAFSQYTKVVNSTSCGVRMCSIVAATAAAKAADAVVLIVGLDQEEETEGLDRTHLMFPGNQQDLIQAVAESTDKTIILVIMSGGPIDVSQHKLDDRIPCILWVGYPGQEGGMAIAQVIFGDYNPGRDPSMTHTGGRLPVTWYPQDFNGTAMTNMHMHSNASTGFPGRTYRFYTGEPVYRFGHGLSYSRFEYTFWTSPRTIYLPKLENKVECHQGTSLAYWTLSSTESHCSEMRKAFCEDIHFDVGIVVANHGPRDGTDVVLLYFAPSPAIQGAPLKQLIAFRRIFLQAHSGVEVMFTIKPCRDFSTVLPNGDRVLNVGLHTLMVGEKLQTISVRKFEGY